MDKTHNMPCENDHKICYVSYINQSKLIYSVASYVENKSETMISIKVTIVFCSSILSSFTSI